MKPCNRHEAGDSIACHFDDAVGWRRLLHRNPQPGWLEFYSTGFISEKLREWGYDLLLGKDAVAADQRLVLPDPARMEAEYSRAIKAGIREEFIVPARGGLTGVVAILKGSTPGPTVGFRFDIDALEITESTDSSHRPAADGFVSGNQGFAHMCGHDAHTSIGLLLALYFAENRDRIKGTVKLIFQPNEENLNGARAMAARGVLDDLDYLLGAHVGIALKETGQICMNVVDWLAMSRFEVIFRGRATHAALCPNEGKNALLGACAAAVNLYAIARHGVGASRVNVGFMQAGTTWNVIPGTACIRMETRGASNDINDYMVRKAKDVLEGAAKMYDLGLEIRPAASTISARNSPELIELGMKVAKSLPSVTEVVPTCSTNGSEDICLMMQHVQQRGGKAMVVLLGTPVGGGHHSNSFDVDERVIRNGAEFFAAMYHAVLGSDHAK